MHYNLFVLVTKNVEKHALWNNTVECVYCAYRLLKVCRLSDHRCVIHTTLPSVSHYIFSFFLFLTLKYFENRSNCAFV